MHTARRLSAFVRTNALLANLCDRKKSLRQRDPNAHRRRHQFLRKEHFHSCRESDSAKLCFLLSSPSENKKETCLADLLTDP